IAAPAVGAVSVLVFSHRNSRCARTKGADLRSTLSISPWISAGADSAAHDVAFLCCMGIARGARTRCSRAEAGRIAQGGWALDRTNFFGAYRGPCDSAPGAPATWRMDTGVL